MRPTKFLLLFIMAFCFISPAGAQTDDFLFDSRPGLTPAEVREIDSAKTSVAAFKTGLYGRVRVRVSIDDTGNVSSVETVSGPGNVCQSVTRADVVAAREAAATAARMVKFEPARVGDQPMASVGWLYFDIGKPEPAPKDDGEKQYFDASNAPPKVPAKVEGKKYTAIGRTTADNIDGIHDHAPAPPSIYKVGSENEVPTIRHSTPTSKALSLPKPPYPPAARAVRAAGPVSVQVLIETDGSVFSSEAVSGHPLLRAAARNAACGANFSPTLLSGQPVKVSGIITYNFIAP